MKNQQFASIITGVTLLAASLLVAGCSQQRQPSNSKETNVVWAASMGRLDLLKSLEAKGTSLDYQEPSWHNWTPLIAAVYFDETNVVSYLLTKRINLDTQADDGKTALMWAITMENTNTVRLLLERGADPAITNRHGSAASIAEAKPQRAVLIQWLNEYAERNRSRSESGKQP
jgi:ankyrin repeat protein